MKHTVWVQHHPDATEEMLGYIPDFLDDDDPRPAREQLHDAYKHGGGWRPFQGFTVLPNDDLAYRGDPNIRLLWWTVLHSTTDKPEIIRFYEHEWLAIFQRDGDFEICRMD